MTAPSDLAWRVADFACQVAADGSPAHVAEALKLLIVDSIGCALGAVDAPAVVAARDAALRLGPAPQAAMLAGGSASVEWAGFVNGLAIRYLDLNDVYVGAREATHPSDTIAAILAMAEADRLSGRDALHGVAIAYEVLCRIIDQVAPMHRGWDGVLLCAVATAAAGSAMLGASRDQCRQAVNIAGAACTALRQTRAGRLSMWKGAAGANASRQGVGAAYLALAGLTGPEPIFEGEFGLQRQVTGDFSWPDDDRWLTLLVRPKKYPAQYLSHTGIEAGIELRSRGVRAGDVRELTISTFDLNLQTAADSDAKWAPQTRETADHSLPYLTAVGLLDGEVGPRQFSAERMTAADVRDLLRKVKVVGSPELTRRYPEEMVCQVEVLLQSGVTISVEVDNPPGHPTRPITPRDATRKLEQLGSDRWSPEQLRTLSDRLWQLDSLTDLGQLYEGLGPWT